MYNGLEKQTCWQNFQVLMTKVQLKSELDFKSGLEYCKYAY